MNFDQFPDRYKEKCRKWDKEKIKEHFGEVPDDFVPMWIADMDFKAPDMVLKKLHEAVDIGVFGYTYVYDEFYDAVMDYFKENHNTVIEKDWITLCYGTVSTLHYTVQAFCTQGDTAVIQTPVYDPFHRAITAHGVDCIECPLVIENNRYYIDFEQLEAVLVKYKPKLYMLCNPHNPSGRIWSKEELIQLLNLCKKYETIVVADEVHSGMIYSKPFVSVSELGELFENVILLSSPNKKYNIGGLKTSYGIIKNPQIRTIFRDKLQKNSVTSPSVFGIIAFLACLNDGKEWSKECMKYIQKNYEYAIDFIEKNLQNVSYMKMESSYLLWIDISKTGITSDIFTSELAKQQGVLVESGNNFVGNGEGWIRINLGTQFSNVKKCFERIQYYMESKKV